MVEIRNDERKALRIAIAREVLNVMVGAMAAQVDLLQADRHTIVQMAKQSVAFAEALLEALGETR